MGHIWERKDRNIHINDAILIKYNYHMFMALNTTDVLLFAQFFNTF